MDEAVRNLDGEEAMVNAQSVSVLPHPHRRRRTRLVVGGAVLALLLVFAAVGQLDSLFGAAFSLGQLPLLAVAVLGWLGPQSRTAGRGAVVALYAIGMFLALALLGALAWLSFGAGQQPTAATTAPLAALGCALSLLLLLPALLLARPVRVLLARWLPLDPDTPRHWLGLVALLWFSLMPLMTLPLLGGEPLLQAMAAQAGQDAIDPISPSTLLYSLGWTVLLALVAVGFPRARRLGGALERLGLTWPGWRAVVVALAISVVMVPVFQGVDQVTTAFVEALGIPPTSSAWIERLFGRTFSLGLALAAAVSAGLGEELIWRGVVQPRYGLVLAALGFGAMHGFQYGLDGLVSVFLAGLVLGAVRQRSNTTVAAVVHGAYDFWGLLGILVGWW